VFRHVTLANVNQFTKFFTVRFLRKRAMFGPTSPGMCCNTTLWKLWDYSKTLVI